VEAPLEVDALVTLSQLTGDFIRSLESLEPYGQNNPLPLFCAVGVEVMPQSIQVLKEQHLKFIVRQEDITLPVMGFRMAERFFTEEMPEKLDLVFTPELNTYNGTARIQLILKDMQAACT
jgi:single-stranded-DNA-specific exonuclease